MELDLPKPDLFIAAVGRSGSTMLANLLTTPPARWVIVEPRFADGSTGRDVLLQAKDFGWELSDSDWNPREGEGPSERLNRIFSSRLDELHRWGLKEVRPGLLQATVDRLKPRRIVVLVRDLRDVAVSLVEKAETDRSSSYDEDWIRGYLADSPAAIVGLVDGLDSRDYRVVRYETLVMDQREREGIGEWLDWPLDGDPGRHLAQIYGREREVELHAGAITDAAVSRWASTTSPRARALSEWAVDENRYYQEKFGYPTSL